MKLKLDLSPEDLMKLNNPESMDEVIAQAHAMLDYIFTEKDKLIKCSIMVDDKE